MTLPAAIGLYLSIGILVALYPLLNGGFESIYNDFCDEGGISQIDRIRIEGRFGPNALRVIALIVFFTYTVFAWPKFLFYMIWPEKDNTYTDCFYCPNCEKETIHEVFESGHERDSSNDSRTCNVCGWRWSGWDGKYSEPLKEE